MGMITQLQKTYDYLPKQNGESERDLTVSCNDKVFEIALSILIANRRYRYALKLERMEIDYSNFDIESVTIESLCKDMSSRLI